ncbi:hypothetical protein [Planomicrobium okeanokoites]|uniref:Uncharacterized protein n=1 Tax=Planomicrobium okeanokoites TaxID=244 RepID=A0ABV7KTE7_PLAOK|nr:hypothetical protein [Planomicrobium okeanokoites]TAA67447.1 hypothetical protein D2910_13735 [Planomicrobium okeanokoites]
MDIEHSDINRIERIGYPNPEYLEWELRQANEPNVEDDEIWPDGLTLDEWQKEKRSPARVNA